MGGCAIVAIPEQDDYIWNLSSEKIPHMTLLLLGEVPEGNQKQISDFVEHVCSSSLRPFGLSVERRDLLGDDKADVLFFNDSTREIGSAKQARDYFLSDSTIRQAYNSTEQHPQWTPHLTMGYPKTPAKKDPRDYPRTSYVWFDKIAIWFGDFEGPTFQLKHPDISATEEVSMAESTATWLEHYGIRGMKWNVRRDNGGSAVEVSTKTYPGKKVVAKGGTNQSPSADAIRVAASKQIAKKSTTDALSTKELQDLVNRMNLEQQYSRLTSTKGFVDKLDNDKKKVDKIMGAAQTANNVMTFMNSPMGKMLRAGIETKLGVKLGRR